MTLDLVKFLFLISILFKYLKKIAVTFIKCCILWQVIRYECLRKVLKMKLGGDLERLPVQSFVYHERV